MTAKMKPEVKALWVEALRSNQYEQGVSVLHNKDANEYCCLGVLCELAIQQGIDITRSTAREEVRGDSDVQVTSYDGATGILPTAVMEWAGLAEANPYTSGQSDTLAGLNDSGSSFEDLAEIIEENL